VNLDRLGDFVERVAGIVIPPRDLPRIEGRLEARWRALDLPDVDSYLDRLERDPLGEETRRLLSLVTINESSLFRSPRQFEVLKETVLPRIRRSHEGMVSVWSAGCARGEEAVSLAITLAEFFGPGPQPWRVVATDLDQEAMAAARNWRFGPRATRLVPEELAQRYLRPRGDAMEVVGDLRRRITFEDQNLTQLPGVLAEYRFERRLPSQRPDLLPTGCPALGGRGRDTAHATRGLSLRRTIREPLVPWPGPGTGGSGRGLRLPPNQGDGGTRARDHPQPGGGEAPPRIHLRP
jgi:chemotaxis methyl-accepting protein methylase